MRPREYPTSRLACLAATLAMVVLGLLVPAWPSAWADEWESPAPTVPVEVSPTSATPTVDPSPSVDPSTPTPSDPVPSATPSSGAGTSTGEPSTPTGDDAGGAEGATGPAGRRARARATVSAVDDAFRPAEITVTVGDVVAWTNLGLNPHTVTADDRSFDSGTLGTGESFSVTVDRVGVVPYYCQIHGEPGSGMFGGVIVEAASEEDGEGGTDPTSPSPTSGVLAGTGADTATPLALAALALATAGLSAMWIGRRSVRRRG